jgi:hypothetical protein
MDVSEFREKGARILETHLPPQGHREAYCTCGMYLDDNYGIDGFTEHFTYALAELFLQVAHDAWDQGQEAATMRVAKELLALLPQKRVTVNPYPVEGDSNG